MVFMIEASFFSVQAQFRRFPKNSDDFRSVQTKISEDLRSVQTKISDNGKSFSKISEYSRQLTKVHRTLLSVRLNVSVNQNLACGKISVHSALFNFGCSSPIRPVYVPGRKNRWFS